MTRDNIIATRIYSPYDVSAGHPDMLEGGWTEGDDRLPAGPLPPFPELATVRSPVQNLYQCSSNIHSAAGIGRGSGYIAAKAICRGPRPAAILGQARTPLLTPRPARGGLTCAPSCA